MSKGFDSFVKQLIKTGPAKQDRRAKVSKVESVEATTEDGDKNLLRILQTGVSETQARDF